MRKLLASALILSISTLGFVGCAEKDEVKTTVEKNTPNGTVKEVDTKEIKKTGDEKTP